MHPYKVLEGNEHAKAGQCGMNMLSGTLHGSLRMRTAGGGVLVREIDGTKHIAQENQLNQDSVSRTELGFDGHPWHKESAAACRKPRARSASPSSKPTKRGCAVSGQFSTTRALGKLQVVSCSFWTSIRGFKTWGACPIEV